MEITWGNTLAVVVVGLVVVFVVLIILVALCSFVGYVFKRIDNKKNNVPTQPKEKKPVAVKKPNIVTAVAPKVESGITGDVVAAISAALACVMGSDAKFAVKSIKRTRESRPAWNAAGLADNTRQF